MPELVCVARYSTLATMSHHGNLCSKARLPFQTEGWPRPSCRKSTLAAGTAPAKLVCCASGLGLKMPPADGHAAKPEVPQPTTRVATPVLEETFEIHTLAAAPWNSPNPPRRCVGRVQ